jgi:hypothetical protein
MIRMMSVIAAGIVVAAFALAAPAVAHHAHGQYETSTIDFEGVVTEFHILNPHAWLYVTRKDASGKEQPWALESDGNKDNFRLLVKQGIGPKAGDVVKVRCHPLRDGAPGCLMGFLKTTDGVTRDFDSGGTPATVPGF